MRQAPPKTNQLQLCDDRQNRSPADRSQAHQADPEQSERGGFRGGQGRAEGGRIGELLTREIVAPNPRGRYWPRIIRRQIIQLSSKALAGGTPRLKHANRTGIEMPANAR